MVDDWVSYGGGLADIWADDCDALVGKRISTPPLGAMDPPALFCGSGGNPWLATGVLNEPGISPITDVGAVGSFAWSSGGPWRGRISTGGSLPLRRLSVSSGSEEVCTREGGNSASSLLLASSAAGEGRSRGGGQRYQQKHGGEEGERGDEKMQQEEEEVAWDGDQLEQPSAIR